MGRLRATLILAAFLALTLPLMPLQALFVRVWPWAARNFPHWYHRRVCRLLGVRFHIDGAVAAGRPVLLVSNHTSWLDIPVLSAVAPVSFVAKREVGTWPFVSALARLQRTVFVDRDRKQAAGHSANEIAERLGQGDTVVLFAEGTSSDGNRVLPFLTSLFGAAKPPAGNPAPPPDTAVQTLALVYTKLHGVPLGFADRPHVGWYGDMEMTSHAWHLLQAGPLDVAIRIGPPIPLADFTDRKALARHSESEVRRNVVQLLRSSNYDADVTIAVRQDVAVNARRPAAAVPGNGKFR
jgi:1-acyl-sn-glycerol-3-phosphate acyltransferase